VVVAGDGSLVEIIEVQPAGKRRMRGEEFARGFPPVSEERLGPETP
jgi:methionyl-tRNA formyltransferase